MRLTEKKQISKRSAKSRLAAAGLCMLETMEARRLLSTTIASWGFTHKESASDSYIAPTDGTAGVSVINGQITGTPTLTAIGMTFNGTADSEDITSTSGTADPSFTEYLWRVRGSGTGTDGDTNGWNLNAPQYSQGTEIDLNTTSYASLDALTFDWYATTSSVKDMMVQYNLNTTNSAGWTNLLSTPLVATPNDYFGGASSSPTNTVDLSGITGAANDPNFGIRLVSAYDPNFSPGAYSAADSDAITQTPITNDGGNWRFGNIDVTGTAATAVAPTITLDPTSQTVDAGTQVTLAADADGSPAPTVQWQISTNGGSTFANILDATSTSYSFTATEGMTGDEFQAVFTNSANSATTDPATLTVIGTPISQWIFDSGLAPTSQSTAPGTANAPYASVQGSPTDSAGTLGLDNDYAAIHSYPEADILDVRSGVNSDFSEYLWRVRGGSGEGPTGSPGTPDGWSQYAPEYSQGVVFDVNTTGYSDVTLQFDWDDGGIADMQPQYSPDGGSTWINVGSVVQASTSDFYGATPDGNPTGVTVDLQGITAADNNPNFELRLVAAYDPALPQVDDGNYLIPGAHGQYASAGFGPVNAEQVIDIGGSTNNFQLTFDGQTTDTIAYDGTPGSDYTYDNMANNIANALQNLSNIGAGNVTVVAEDQTGTRFLVTYTGTMADTPEDTMTSSDPNATVTTWVNGTDSPDGVTRYVDGGGNWRFGNITFNGDKTTGAPGITQEPASTSVAGGLTATFTATAYSESTPLSVYWQVRTNGGSSYTEIPGSTELDGSTSTYSFTTNTDLSENGNLYEAVFTNPDGSTATLPATLTVVGPSAPVVTTQPYDASVEGGNVAIFAADASGSPTPSIQWQINTGSGWTDLTDSATVYGSTLNSLQFTSNADGSDNGDQFRAVFTNSVNATTSDAATLTVLQSETDITSWDFNQDAQVYVNSPAPTGGVVDVGTALPVGMTLPYNPADPATGVDGNGSVPADDITNTAGAANPSFNENTWRVRGGPSTGVGGTPANGWSNFAPEYTQGVQFSVPTTGYDNIYVTMDWYSTTSGILNAQEQYTIDGTHWINTGPELQAVSNDFYGATPDGAPVPLVIDVSAIPGAANNPNFGIRLVSAYNPDLPLVQDPNNPDGGLVGQYANAALVGDGQPAPYNGSKGNWRFDNIEVHGDIAPVSVLSAQAAPSPSQSINLQFSNDVSATLTSASSLQITPLLDGNSDTATSLSFNTSDNTATFGLSSPLSSGMYQGVLSSAGVADTYGGTMTGDYTFDFVLVNNNGTLTLPSGSQTYTVQQVLVGTGATLDIGNNTIYDQYASGNNPAASIGAAITSGYDNGQWDGTGIISSTAAADSSHTTGVGYFDDGTQVKIARTWYGDANADGVINADDLSLIMVGLAQHVTAWQDGNFNYDSQVNADDLIKLLYVNAYSGGQQATFSTASTIQSDNTTSVIHQPATNLQQTPAFADTPIGSEDNLNDLLDSSQATLA